MEAVSRTRPPPSLESAGVSGAQVRRLRPPHQTGSSPQAHCLLCLSRWFHVFVWPSQLLSSFVFAVTTLLPLQPPLLLSHLVRTSYFISQVNMNVGNVWCGDWGWLSVLSWGDFRFGDALGLDIEPETPQLL